MTSRPRATYRDVLDAPEHKVAEIIDGTLYLQPRPASLQALAKTVLGSELGGPFQKKRNGPGGWWIIDEPELHLGEQIIVPDLAGWRRERMPEYPDAPYFTLAPDWVCEILSPLHPAHRPLQEAPDLCRAGHASPVVHRPRRAGAGSLRVAGR